MLKVFRDSSLVLVILAALCFVGLSLSRGNAVAQVNPQPGEMPPPSNEGSIRPLDLIRRAKEAQQNINQNARDARVELRTDTREAMQNAGAGERPGIMRDAVEDRIGIARDRLASTTNLREKAKGVMRQHTGLIKERFALAVRQFDQIVGRIESRIEKLKAAGVDTTAAETELSEAKAAKAIAQEDAKAVADFVASLSEASDRESARTQMKALVAEAQASIRAAHAALQEAVKALKGLSVPPPPPSAAGTVEAGSPEAENAGIAE